MKKLNEVFQNRKYQLLLVASILSIIISIAAYIYYKNEVQNILTSKESEFKTLASLKTEIISSSIIDEYNDAYLISTDKVLMEFLINNKKYLFDYLTSLKKQHEYDNIIVTDNKAKILESSNRYLELNPYLINFIKNVSKSKKIVSTEIYYCYIHKKIHIDIIAPIIKNGKVIAVITLEIDPETTIYPLLKESPIKYSSLENYIARKDKDSITVISPLKYKPNAVLIHKYSYSDTTAAIVKATKGYTSLVEAKDYRGVEVVAFVNRIPNTNWYMVTKIDKKELYDEILTESYLLISLTIIIIISIFTSLSFIYSYRQRNLYRSLYRSEQEFETALKSIGDAVITTDKEGKLKFLNPVAEELTGWSFDEAVNKPITEIFNIINEITRKPVENPVKKVLQEGKIIGLANHTILISKDGKEIPIADSGAPITDKSGNIVGVVLVIQDQTKEREVRRKIEESESKLNALINNRTESFWSLDKNYRLIICNEYFKNAYKAAYNYELEIGINLVEILSPELKAFWKPKYDEALAGNKVAFEFSENIYGKKHYFAVYLNPIYTNGEITGITALSTDITDFKTLQFELAKSEEKYRLISDLVSDYVFSTIIKDDGTSELEWVAGNFEEITGYTLEDYKAAGGWPAHLHPDSVLQDQEDMKKILNNEKIDTEVKTFRKDKSAIWVRVFAQPYFDKEQNRVTKIYGAVQSINERKLARLALEESEHKFSIAFNESPVALSIQDEKNIFLDVNQAFCDLTGYSKQEIIGKTGKELKLWVNKEEAKNVNKIFKETGSIKNYEFLFRKKSGEIRNGIISATTIYINGEKADLATAFDITDLKNAQIALEKSEKKLLSIFAALPDIFLILDKNGKYVEIAPSNESLLYKPANELIGKTLHEIFEKEIADKFLNLVLKTLNDGKANKMDYELDINGTPIWFQATTVPYEEDKVIYIASDITDRKIKEQKILDQLDELRRWQNLMLDREDRVIELKHEVNDLLKKLGKENKYNI